MEYTQQATSISLNNSSPFIINYDTKSQIENNLTYYILTNPGETIGKPFYGFGLLNYLFEQTPEQDIQKNLESKLEATFNNIDFSNIKIQKNGNILYIIIEYRYINNQTNTLTLQINTNNSSENTYN